MQFLDEFNQIVGVYMDPMTLLAISGAYGGVWLALRILRSYFVKTGNKRAVAVLDGVRVGTRVITLLLEFLNPASPMHNPIKLVAELEKLEKEKN